MPHQTEPSANNALGNLLQGMLGKAVVRSENTQVIQGHAGYHPDILITATGRSPVVIEAEYDPALNVEPEARDRLNLHVTGQVRPIEAAIALRYPEAVGDSLDLTAAIREATLRYCVFTAEGEKTVRFPESGWLDGSLTDLAETVRLISVPQAEVLRAVVTLEDRVDAAATILAEIPSNTLDEINELMGLPKLQAPKGKKSKGQDPIEQTCGMACAIIVNAMVFHERIEGSHALPKLRDTIAGQLDPQSTLLNAWEAVLDVNYWPIFHVGRSILDKLPASAARKTIETLYEAARAVSSSELTYAHDVTGRLLQRFITDRKYLASFYTLPPSAALLSRLCVERMQGVDWGDEKSIGQLKIADFACGTGALLGAVYAEVAKRHEDAGGDAEKLHKRMIEEVLYGCDIMPAAIHITGSTLSGIQPGRLYEDENLYQPSYGRLDSGGVSIGSLELLKSTGFGIGLLNMEMSRIGGKGREDAPGAEARMLDGSFDLVIMNPPFTRAGSDWEEAGKVREFDDYIKQFKGLGTTLDVQQAMTNQLTNYTEGTCYHGYAGLGSAFAALADRKVKPGGTIGLILPVSVASGASWEKLRRTLVKGYRDIVVITLAANDKDPGGMAFSADTGMGDCLIVGQKRRPYEEPETRIKFVSLKHRPLNFLVAQAVAYEILNATKPRTLEDGPFGGTKIALGREPSGSVLDGPIGNDGEEWGTVRLADGAVAQAAYALAQGSLWLPAQAQPTGLPTVKLSTVGHIGLYHRNIAEGDLAPFTKGVPNPTSTYPCLWNHNAKIETMIVCQPDSQLHVLQGMENKAAEVWATSSRSHINQDFRFNSQPLAVAFTERKSMGGRAWPNVRFDDERLDYPFAIWSNSTLGLLSFWRRSNLQQPGRGIVTISTVSSLPVLDFRTLSDEQLATAERIFDEFRELDLMPAYLADADPNRALLDRRVVCDLLGFDEDIYRGVRRLAEKWCAEPSVHGGKARPKSATYVE